MIKILPVQMGVVLTSCNKTQINPANSMNKSDVSNPIHKTEDGIKQVNLRFCLQFQQFGALTLYNF
jgi:hypothetical protein